MDKIDTFTIMSDTFGKTGSDEQVEGLTLIIDGKLKEVFDTIIAQSGEYDSYTDIFNSVVVQGINEIINKLK